MSHQLTFADSEFSTKRRQVVVPLPAERGVQRTSVKTDVRDAQHGRRRAGTEGVDHRAAQRADQGRALQVEPWRVEHQRRHPLGVPSGPQRGDQPARRVADQHELVVVGRDHVGGRPELDVVVVQVGDEAGQVAAPQAPAVAAQVDGVEVDPEGGELVGEVGLEEVVVPAVHVVTTL